MVDEWEERRMRRERLGADAETVRTGIAEMRADVAAIRREARFPSTMLAAFVLAIVGPWLLSLV